MQLTRDVDITNGIVTASIVCSEISEETKEALHDFTKVLRYSNIDFSAKIKVTNGMPEIVSDDDPDGEEVTVALIDKSFVVDENLSLELKLDSNKMTSKELTSTISNVEILSKAKAIIWIDRVMKELQRLLTEAREQNSANIEGTTEEIV